jgi:hypothetical protein
MQGYQTQPFYVIIDTANYNNYRPSPIVSLSINMIT